MKQFQDLPFGSPECFAAIQDRFSGMDCVFTMTQSQFGYHMKVHYDDLRHSVLNGMSGFADGYSYRVNQEKHERAEALADYLSEKRHTDAGIL